VVEHKLGGVGGLLGDPVADAAQRRMPERPGDVPFLLFGGGPVERVSRSLQMLSAGTVTRIRDRVDDGHGQTSLAAADQVKTHPGLLGTDMRAKRADLGANPE
jgi:hypothetical protein